MPSFSLNGMARHGTERLNISEEQRRTFAWPKVPKVSKEGLLVLLCKPPRKWGGVGRKFGETTESFVNLFKGCAVKGAEPLSHSAEGEILFGVSFL